MYDRAIVYWAHLKDHTDMWADGYIGCTAQKLNERWSYHKYSASRSNCMTGLAIAIRKYGVEAIVMEEIVIGDRDYCIRAESLMRPAPNIGWNVGIGGASAILGTTHTEQAKQRMSMANTGKKKPITVCPHCLKSGGAHAMARWHFENCKNLNF